MTFFTKIPSPLGEITLVSDGQAITGLWLDTQVPRMPLGQRRDDLPLFDAAKGWLDAYFQGAPQAICFPLAPGGTPFQKQVWDILLTIPYGQTTTYGAIARAIGPNMSAQAVGQAVGRNPISIVIPCHRCVGAGNKLTGYHGGVDKKIWLLRHEGK